MASLDATAHIQQDQEEGRRWPGQAERNVLVVIPEDFSKVCQAQLQTDVPLLKPPAERFVCHHAECVLGCHSIGIGLREDRDEKKDSEP